MDIAYLHQRFENMLTRLDEAYDGIGNSSGRPYLYFVYPPESEQRVHLLVDEQMIDNGDLRFLHLDLVRLTQETLAGYEEKRTAMLKDPNKSSGAAESIMRLWARHVRKRIQEQLDEMPAATRPVVVLRGLAALHPIGHPTMLMEVVAEVEPRNPVTNQTVPVVLLIPGTHRPQVSRTYCFLGLDELQLTFYRGEEF